MFLFNSRFTVCNKLIKKQGESVVWWSNIIFILTRRVVFRGSRHVTSTSRHPGTRHVKSLPLTGPGVRHITSLRPDRGSTHHVIAGDQVTIPSLRLSVGEFYLLRFDPLFSFRRRGFFHRFTTFVTHTLRHISVRGLRV